MVKTILLQRTLLFAGVVIGAPLPNPVEHRSPIIE
jgi:hypothetical protein